MHQIASQLPEYDCYFSQLYSSHPVLRIVNRTGLLDHTILAGEFKRTLAVWMGTALIGVKLGRHRSHNNIFWKTNPNLGRLACLRVNL
jgi:hypothetical protein